MNPLETVTKAAKKLADTTKKAVGTVVPMVGVATALNVGTPEYLEAEEKPKTQQVTNDNENQNEQDTFDVRALNELDLLKLLLFVRPFHREYNSETNDIGASLPHIFVPTGKNNEYYDLPLYLGDKKLKSLTSKKDKNKNALDAVKNIVKNMSTFDLLKQSELFFEQQTSSKIYKECQNLYAQLDNKYEFTTTQKTVFFVLYYLNSEDLKTVLNEIDKTGNDTRDINAIFANLAHKKTKTEDIAILYWLNALYIDMINFDTISDMKVSSFETAITNGKKLTLDQFKEKVFYDDSIGKFKLDAPTVKTYVKQAQSKSHKTNTLDKNGNTPYVGNIVDNAVTNETYKNPTKEQEKQKWVNILDDILEGAKNIKKHIINLDSPLLENIDVENKAKEISGQQTQKTDTNIATETKPENNQQTKKIIYGNGTTQDDPYKVRVRSDIDKLNTTGTLSTNTPVKLTEKEEKEISKIEKELEKEVQKYMKDLKGYVFDFSKLSNPELIPGFIEREILSKTFASIIIRNYFYETQFYDGGYDGANVLTSFGGLTWALNDLNLDGKKLNSINHIRTIGSSVLRNKMSDFLWSLSYKQKLNQIKLFLKLYGGDGILYNLINYIQRVNNGIIDKKEYFEDTYNTILSEESIKNAVSPSLLLSLFKAGWQSPQNGKDIFLRLSPYGDKETANFAFAMGDSFGTLKRLFWTYLDAKGKIDTQTYLKLGVDGIAYLLDDFVFAKCKKIGKPVKGNKTTMQDYINAGVFIKLKKPISLSKAYKERGDTTNKEANYSFTTDNKLIKEIIEHAKTKSAEDQKARNRNTILRQIAYDLYRFNISVKEFFNTGKNVTAGLNPVQKILFERVRCQTIKPKDAVKSRRALIKYTKEVLGHVTDPKTKELLETIIKEESQRVGDKVEEMKRSTEIMKMLTQQHEQQTKQALKQFGSHCILNNNGRV